MMQSNSFIETGVAIGYCVLLDPHHAKCKSYLDGDGEVVYTSEEVWDEYEDTKEKVTSRLSSAVFDHVRDVENNVTEDYLGPVDVNHVKKNVLNRNNEAFQFLYRYYDNVVNNGVPSEELEKNLREIARDIDRLVISREDDLGSMVEDWNQTDDHKLVENNLSAIHNPDRMFAVQAHDLACNKNSYTEFATTNPSDFMANGRKALVLSNTELDDVVDLSV